MTTQEKFNSLIERKKKTNWATITTIAKEWAQIFADEYGANKDELLENCPSLKGTGERIGAIERRFDRMMNDLNRNLAKGMPYGVYNTKLEKLEIEYEKAINKAIA